MISHYLFRLTKLLKAEKEAGLTLVELLVTIIILSLLLAIALPSLLNQTNKARVVEAESSIRNINQKQLLRLNGGKNFATDLATLGSPTESASYTYSITITGSGANQAAVAIANPKTDALEPVQGRVALITNSAGERDTATLICRTDNIAALPPTTTVCPE